MKTLYLHAGGNKTGSSALQVFFSQYARALEQHGFAYKNNSEVRHEYQITPGNGYALFELLVSTPDNFGIGDHMKTDARHKLRRVNRSLTNHERNYLRDFNRRYGGQFSEEVSDRLIYSKPECCSETPPISDRSVDILQKKFQADITWVNQTFLDGIDGMSISSSHSVMREIYRDILNNAICTTWCWSGPLSA